MLSPNIITNGVMKYIPKTMWSLFVKNRLSMMFFLLGLNDAELELFCVLGDQRQAWV